ncbi:GGDEF domain-containing protein [Candidatus Woesearchaeota archaeon]|nr:GGDEF domain-containing protein [Candidatus Woesearchaeota archaeon]
MVQRDLDMLLESLPSRVQTALVRATGQLPEREKERMFLYFLGLSHNERVGTIGLYASTKDSRQRKVLRNMMTRQITDQLTGLYNRFHFDSDLELTLWEVDREERRRIEQIREHPRNNSSSNGHKERKSLHPDASLLFLDIDYFKRVNDTYGHPIGDKVLKEVAYWIVHSLRRGDTRVSRLGGEEIGIILKQTDENQGVIIAERIRKGVEENLRNYFATIPVIAEQEYSPPSGVTISIGVANYRKTCRKPEVSVLKHQADVALYAAKASGRNGVILYAPELERDFRKN